MQRSRPDGVLLAWRLTGSSPDGVLPFLIDWGSTPHPAGTAPDGVELAALELCHPEPDRVWAVLDAWSLTGIRVRADPAARLRAVLRGPAGSVVLE